MFSRGSKLASTTNHGPDQTSPPYRLASKISGNISLSKMVGA
jgi:hypothetical protein